MYSVWRFPDPIQQELESLIRGPEVVEVGGIAFDTDAHRFHIYGYRIYVNFLDCKSVMRVA